MPQCFPFFTVLWPPSGYVPVKDVKITKHFIADSHEPQQRKWKLLDEKFQNPIDRYGDFKLLDFLSCAGNVIQSNKLSCELVVVRSVPLFSPCSGRARLPCRNASSVRTFWQLKKKIVDCYLYEK